MLGLDLDRVRTLLGDALEAAWRLHGDEIDEMPAASFPKEGIDSLLRFKITDNHLRQSIYFAP